MKKEKSIFVTYFLWFLFGWLGLHHFYLGRDRQAFVWWSTLGGIFFLGWFRDLWRIPAYVDDANDETYFIADLTNRMKLRKYPRFSIVRFAGQLMVGYFYGNLVKMALPPETYLWLEIPLVCVGMTIGVHLIGNIGREKGSFLKPLIATIAMYLILYYLNPEYVNYAYCVLLCACVFNQLREYRRTYENHGFLKRVFVFWISACLVMSLWGCFFYFNAEITTEDGETIKIRDSINHFFKSPAWLEFKNTLWQLYEEGQRNGWRNLYDEFVKALDPKGEANARKVLNVTETSSKEEIKRAYKKLVRKWHPDKNKGSKEEAEKRFMEIQEAYEILTSKKRSEFRSE